MNYDKALEKAMRYCSYQERCRLDLENRFIAWNVSSSQWEKLIKNLTLENFLNEERYIAAFVRGKFFIKKWGKNKVRIGLKQKNLKGPMVEKAIQSEIDDEEYLNVIKQLIDKKSQLIREADALKKRDRIYRYLLGKGYESELVVSCLNAY